MPTPPNPTPDFTTLAARALMCCQQWRAWAKRQPANHPHIKHAYELAQLFERQAGVLNRMHKTRVEWHPIRRDDFKGFTK